MFATLPYNLQLKSESDLMSSDVAGSAKLLTPGRVTAATNIPQGAITTPINPGSLSGCHDIVQIMVGTTQHGIIELDTSSRQVWNSELHWIRAVRLSEDCHSYNVQLKLQATSLDQKSDNLKLILQTNRPISVGQELIMWFSEDILSVLQMVFLVPANIQGQKKYVCTKCSTLYESPNPLKLHITLGCGRQTVSYLWDKLRKGLNDRHSPNLPEFTFKLTPASLSSKQKSLFVDTVTSAPQTDCLIPQREDSKVLYRPYSEPSSVQSSSFKPFRKTQMENDKSNQSSLPENLQCWPNIVFAQNFYSNQGSLFNRSRTNTDDEAHIETLVSSLGKSKEGHICLYCGKCYSRKYGLKIHIRTHTGYKPLKCKFCLRPFGDPSNLNKHVRLHAEGDTPYRCDLCGKVLVRRRDLERHLKSRHMSEIHPGTSIVQEENNREMDISDEEDMEGELDVDR